MMLSKLRLYPTIVLALCGPLSAVQTTQPSYPLAPYSAIVRPTRGGAQHAVEVAFNGVPRYLLPDTGSADTWMVAEGWQCLDAALEPAPKHACDMAQPYTGPPVARLARDVFYERYGTGEVAEGPLGWARVSLAGLEVPAQHVALVERGHLIGDGVRSGYLGLARRPNTQGYRNESAATAPPNGTVFHYPPIVHSMFATGNLSANFSLALQRGPQGGFLSFGGLPPVEFEPDFVSTDLVGISVAGGQLTKESIFYPIKITGFGLGSQTHERGFVAIVDSGTPAFRLPTSMAQQINAAFQPPATYHAELGLYVTACNATAPKFEVGVAGRMFDIDSRDMFIPGLSSDEQCVTSITNGYVLPGDKNYPDGLYALGDAFLNNVIAVFDIENERMLFAAHDSY